MEENLKQFLNSQGLLVIATVDDGSPWIYNVYYGLGDDGNLYFISNEETMHSRHILNHGEVAFSVAWYDAKNHKNRKAVQDHGACRKAEDEEEIKTGVNLHNRNFPEFAERITLDWVKDDSHASTVWVISPTYMKFWNDELFGPDGTREFRF